MNGAESQTVAHVHMKRFGHRFVSILLDEAPMGWSLGASAAVGAALALHVFGISYILGTSPFWSYPVGDAGMMLNGWNYFVHQGWGLPLARAGLAHWPTGVSLVYYDAIPLVAIAGKVFVRAFAATFNPYGAWHAAIYVLQAVFGALAARVLGVRSLAGALVFAVFSITTPAFLLRFFHEGLNAHFVLLWALVAYFSSRRTVSALHMAGVWSACLACALLIHPYLAAMALILAACVHLEVLRSDWRRALASGALCACALTVVWLLAGYTVVKPNEWDVRSFGAASMNLLSPLLPSPFWVPEMPSQDTTGMQWDGQNFAGFGVLALLVLSLVAARAELLRVLGRHKVLAVALVLLTAYSLGDRWSFGSRVFFEPPYPDWLRQVLATFRATGRFFWPVGYALMLLAGVTIARRFGRKGLILLSAAALVQAWGAAPLWQHVSKNLSAPWERYLDWTAWEAALEGHGETVSFPSFSCWPRAPDERVSRMEREIEFMAARRGMRVDDGHTARSLTNCDERRGDMARALRDGPQPGIVYILFRPVFDADTVASFAGDRCAPFSEGWVCSADRSAFVRQAFSRHADRSGATVQ